MTVAERKCEIADKIIENAADNLSVGFKPSALALSSLTFCADSDISSVETDGESLFFSPDFIIESYTRDKNAPAHMLLHEVFHCLFRHMYAVERKNVILWNISCDISVENAISELSLNCAKTRFSGEIKTLLARLKKEIKNITAMSVYSYFVKRKITGEELETYRKVFSLDSHNAWYKNYTTEIEEDSFSEEAETPSIYTYADDRPTRNEDEENRNSGDYGKSADDENRDRWERIAQKAQIYAENESSDFGTGAGNALCELRRPDSDKLDYASFLSDFCRCSETVETDPYEFDNIYYTYGMKLYKNMPLIEPLEYREADKIKELFIAIDTSGSVRGDAVRRFLEATFSVLESTDSFFESTEVHIIQCDAAIQDDFTVKNHKDIEEYRENLQLSGFGGTDFRPVFDYIENMYEPSRLRKINGLIYFTDGDGRYPDRAPPYKTAFLLSGSKHGDKVPFWCAKMLLGEEKLEKIIGEI